MVQFFVLAALVAGNQESVQEWIEKLSSDRVEVREEAARRLKALGARAASGLRKAASGPDGDSAARAAAILRAIEIREMLTPALLGAFPGVEDRLASGGDSVWTDVFLRAYIPPEKRTPGGPELDRRDFRPLVARALRGCRTPDEKVEVMRLSAHFELREGIPGMISFLSEGDRVVILAALDGLATLGASEAIPEIHALARRERDDPRNHAIRALCRLRARDAAPEMIELLKTPWHYMQSEAAEAVGELGIREAVPVLLPLLRNDSWSLRVAVVQALAQLGASEAAPLLGGLLQDRDEGVREAAAEALGTLGAKGEIPALVAALKGGTVRVKAKAAESLGSLGAREHAGEVLSALRSDSFVAPVATAALAQMGAKDFIPDLWEMLKADRDGSGQIREALAHLGAERLIPELSRMIKDTDWKGRRCALDSLRIFRFRDSMPEIRSSLQDEEEELAAEATLTLGEMGDRESVPGILARMKRGPAERLDCVEALGLLTAKEAVPLLRPLLRHGEWPVVSAAAEALGRIGDRESGAELVRLLFRPEQSAVVVDSVLRALVRMEAREAVPELARFFHNDRDFGRLEAAEALCLLGSREGVPLILAKGEFMFSLNALRNPGAWAVLEQKTLRGDLKGPQAEIVASLAKEAGLTLDDSAVRSGLYPAWKLRLIRLPNRGGSKTVQEGLGTLVDGEFSCVLEQDRLRILSRTQALEFWRAWARLNSPK